MILRLDDRNHEERRNVAAAIPENMAGTMAANVRVTEPGRLVESAALGIKKASTLAVPHSAYRLVRCDRKSCTFTLQGTYSKRLDAVLDAAWFNTHDLKGLYLICPYP